MPEFDKKKGNKSLPQDIKERILNFYQDELNGNVRVLPGKKDSVRIGIKSYKQKMLILCTLNELYAKYKEMYPDDKVSFSYFCLLRPKWCVLAGSSGTHSVCVCTIHQNFELLLAAKSKLSYKDVIEEVVCDTKSKDCMLDCWVHVSIVEIAQGFEKL